MLPCFLLACAIPDAMAVGLDPVAWTADERATVAAAVVSMGGHAVGPGDPWDVWIGRHDGATDPLGEPCVVGRTYHVGASATIDLWPDALGPGGLRTATMHELGHALGARHVPGHAVMAAELSYVQELTPADVAEIRRVRPWWGPTAHSTGN